MTDFHPHDTKKHSGPLKPRIATERGKYQAVDFNRRQCQDHGYIEDYVDHELIPLDPVERRQVQFWTITCVLFWVAVIAAAVCIGAAS